MARRKKERGPLPTIWHASDMLWAKVERVLCSGSDPAGSRNGEDRGIWCSRPQSDSAACVHGGSNRA